jgi:hypothetical protein
MLGWMVRNLQGKEEENSKHEGISIFVKNDKSF